MTAWYMKLKRTCAVDLTYASIQISGKARVKLGCIFWEVTVFLLVFKSTKMTMIWEKMGNPMSVEIVSASSGGKGLN